MSSLASPKGGGIHLLIWLCGLKYVGISDCWVRFHRWLSACGRSIDHATYTDAWKLSTLVDYKSWVKKVNGWSCGGHLIGVFDQKKRFPS
ncbi:MAG: hypothetical protein MJA29_03970, partial [Candidatus Omnitrophica bacterium]|nr:hypothetical protein [Candidatus Omnitrophota bacterium]